MQTPNPPHAPSTVFQRALNRYLSCGKASARELARVADVSAQHIRAVAREDKHLSPEKMAKLSSWLVDELGLTQHLEGFLGMTGEVHFVPESVENDDDIRCEIMAARQDAARAIDAFDEDRREEAARHLRKGIADMTAALQDVQTPA